MDEKEITIWVARNQSVRAEILSLVSNIDGFIGLQMAERFSFNREQSSKFHRIFFDASRVTFHAKIEIYKQFLREYEPELLDDKCRELPALLEEVKTVRNIFAHSSDPMTIELYQKDFQDMPYAKVYRLKDGQNEPQGFTEEEYREIYQKIQKARELMVLILTNIMNARNKSAQEIADLIKSQDVDKWVGRACGNCGYRVKEGDTVVDDKCPRCKHYDLNGDELHYGL